VSRILSLAVLLVSVSAVVPPAIADSEKERLVAFLKEIDAIVEKDGVQAAVKKIESPDDTAQVMRNYFVTTSHAYRKRHDVDLMLAFGDAGIAYLLDQAAKAGRTDAGQAEKLRGFAKAMAYNLSANAWPGWNETGINITPEHSKAAMRLARENLRLGIELKRAADVIGNAHWLIGAQHLALKRPDKAIEEFKKAVQGFAESKKPDYRHMAEGYIGIAQLTQAETRNAGRKTLDKALAALAARKTGDAKFFASQLKTVERVFVD